MRETTIIWLVFCALSITGMGMVAWAMNQECEEEISRERQAQLDSLYASMVGMDDSSLLMTLRDAKATLNEYCRAEAKMRGVDPAFCD